MAVYGNMIESILDEQMILKDIQNIITESERNFDIVTEANISEIVEKIVDKILVFIQKCIATIKQTISKIIGRKYVEFWKKYDFKNFEYSDENNETIKKFLDEKCNMFKINEEIVEKEFSSYTGNKIYRIIDGQVSLHLQQEITRLTTRLSCMSEESISNKDILYNLNSTLRSMRHVVFYTCGKDKEDFYNKYYLELSNNEIVNIINILNAKYLKDAYISMDNFKGVMSNKRYINYLSKLWVKVHYGKKKDKEAEFDFNNFELGNRKDGSKYFSNKEVKDTTDSGYSVFVQDVVSTMRTYTREVIAQFNFFIQYTSLLMKLSNYNN